MADTPAIEGSLQHLLSRVNTGGGDAEITVQVGSYFITGTLKQAEDITDRSRIILHDTALFTPDGIFMKPPVWEVRLSAIDGWTEAGIPTLQKLFS